MSMILEPTYKPQLRPVEAYPLPESEGSGIVVYDRTGLSEAVLTVSGGALQLLALMDGTRSVAQIRAEMETASGQVVEDETVHAVVHKLDESYLLESDCFNALYLQRTEEFRKNGKRTMLDPASLGLDGDSAALFDAMLGEADPSSPEGTVVGIIAPHLDYPRGRPCYASAYGVLRGRRAPQRVVILGTNHIGRATSVVGTGSNFVTPLGETRTDVALLDRLEGRCGDLRRCELDHAWEHSIELQVAWLQHLFGAKNFEMLAFLCPDPCGPTRTAPHNGQGVDLRDFAAALRTEIEACDAETLMVAGADLSHVGSAFGADPNLDDAFLARVRIRDENALACLAEGDAERFRCSVAQDDNPTRVCSAGCMYVAASVLRDASPSILRYHQAVDQSTQTCVTCAAVAYTR